jgi:hypothetical protein
MGSFFFFFFFGIKKNHLGLGLINLKSEGYEVGVGLGYVINRI